MAGFMLIFIHLHPSQQQRSLTFDPSEAADAALEKLLAVKSAMNNAAAGLNRPGESEHVIAVDEQWKSISGNSKEVSKYRVAAPGLGLEFGTFRRLRCDHQLYNWTENVVSH